MTAERSERSGISIAPPVRTQDIKAALQHHSSRGLSDNSKWLGCNRGGSDVTLRSSSAVVVRQPGEAFSTHTVLRKCGPALQIGCRRKDVARAGARQVHSRRRQELEIARRMPDTAGNRIQPGAPQYARSDHHRDEAFSLLAQSHSQPDQVPRRCL
jgi:hypothetical protein